MTNENPESSKILSTSGDSGNSPSTESRRQAPAAATGVSISGFKEVSAARDAGMKKGDIIIEYGWDRNLTVETLASLAAREGKEGVGIQVVFLRGGRQDTVRLPSGPLGISAMDTTIQDYLRLKTASDRIERTVLVIQRVYLVISILGILVLLSYLVKSRGVEALLQGALMTVLNCVSYLGLRYRQHWVITLILIVSALSCLGIFFQILQPADSVRALFDKILLVLILLFYAYQIHFFRKPEVRQLFGDRGYLVV
jgi:hypothetical protein